MYRHLFLATYALMAMYFYASEWCCKGKDRVSREVVCLAAMALALDLALGSRWLRFRVQRRDGVLSLSSCSRPTNVFTITPHHTQGIASRVIARRRGDNQVESSCAYTG